MQLCAPQMNLDVKKTSDALKQQLSKLRKAPDATPQELTKDNNINFNKNQLMKLLDAVRVKVPACGRLLFYCTFYWEVL